MNGLRFRTVRVMSPVWMLFILLCAGVMTACTTTGTPLPPVATQTLIPATPTFTPVPVTPTLPPPTLPQPADIGNISTPTPIAPLLSAEITLPDAFVEQMMNDLASFLKIDVQIIRYARLERMTWLDNEDLGCNVDPAVKQPEYTTTGYSLTFVYGKITYVYHTAGTERFRRCEVTGTIADDVLMAVDPVAQEMVGLAQRQVAQTLDLPVRRIRLITVQSYTWADSSLGCPQDGITYEAVEIPGYRILVGAGDNEYVFHTDSERLYPCDVKLEKLPG